MTIVIKKQGKGYIAHKEGMPETWEFGYTKMEALGKLVFTFKGELDIEVA